MKKITTLFMLLTLAGCGGGVSDFTEELGHGYTFDHSGPTLKMIWSTDSNQSHIYGTVTDFSYNDEFILACQIPNREAHKAIIGSNLMYHAAIRFPDKPEPNIEESKIHADSVIRHSPYYQKIFSHKLNYWIICHKYRKMYGPLTKKEYLAKRGELKVPDDLQLKEDTTQLN